VLSDLVSGAIQDASERRALRTFAEVEAAALARPAALDALAALAPASRVRIIAEVKGRKFGGSLADLEAVRDAVTVPVLRKDFIAEPYQVLEARAAGADLVLLIVAALDQSTLSDLFDLSSQLGMAVLVETHSADEVSRALDIGAGLVGVYARDLSTFELDQDLFGRLAGQIPSGVIRVAESAVLSAADVQHYREAGADVVLVGEALVTGNPVQTLAHFLSH
jgi:indole-3-glycerol phosphate synthase